MEVERVVMFVVAVAAVIGIFAGGIYIANHLSAGCVDLGFWKSCGVVTH